MIEDHPVAPNTPNSLDSRYQAAFFGFYVLEQRSLEANLSELDHFGTEVVAQLWMDFLKADDAAELKLDRTGRQNKSADH